MSSFLKLSKICINTNHIRNINIKPSKYEIKLSIPNIEGFILFGSGNIDTNYHTIDICEKESNEDYNVIKKWIIIQEENSK